MRLAEKFMFVTEEEDGATIYTAQETDTGDYRVSWLDDGYSNFKTLPYDRDAVRSKIINGEWRVREVFPKEEKPALKYAGRGIRSMIGNVYKLEAHESGEKYVLIGDSGVRHDHGYTEDRLENNVREHFWKWLEPEVAMEPSDDVVADNWPFPVSSAGTHEEPVVDYNLTLLNVRESIRGLNSAGWVVEICADFFTVKQDGDVYSNKFVASNEEDLAAIFQAIRTLDKYVDRG